MNMIWTQLGFYIAPIEKSAKLKEYQKGFFDGHKETMDG